MEEMAYPGDYNRRWFYAGLKALARKGVLAKHGLDTDIVKLYVCRRFGVVGLTQLDDRQYALIAAEVNLMNDDAEICEKRCVEIKKFLLDGAQDANTDSPDSPRNASDDSVKVSTHKKGNGANTERFRKYSPQLNIIEILWRFHQ
jgi:hypothetical protein